VILGEEKHSLRPKDTLGEKVYVSTYDSHNVASFFLTASAFLVQTQYLWIGCGSSSGGPTR